MRLSRRICRSVSRALPFFARELNFLNAVRKSGPLHVASPELRAKVQADLERRTIGTGGGTDSCRSRVVRSRFSWVVAIAAAIAGVAAAGRWSGALSDKLTRRNIGGRRVLR